jgi:hypothetical protein
MELVGTKHLKLTLEDLTGAINEELQPFLDVILLQSAALVDGGKAVTITVSVVERKGAWAEPQEQAS